MKIKLRALILFTVQYLPRCKFFDCVKLTAMDVFGTKILKLPYRRAANSIALTKRASDKAHKYLYADCGAQGGQSWGQSTYKI